MRENRALGLEIASGSFSSFWVYLLAPTLGGIIAALTYDRAIGRATTPPPESERASAGLQQQPYRVKSLPGSRTAGFCADAAAGVTRLGVTAQLRRTR